MNSSQGAKETSDQRKHKRLRVQDGVYVVLRNETHKLGMILDVSPGGLAFKYVDDDGGMEASFELDIFLAGHGLVWKGVPHKTVSDVETERGIPFSSVRMRRRGVQFKDLSRDHLSHLEYVIQNQTASGI